MINLDSNKYKSLSEEEKKLVQEAYEAGVDDVLDEIYEEAVFDLEMNLAVYDEDKIMRKRLPNHPSTLDPNNPKDTHQKAPIMKKKIPAKIKL